MLPKSYFSYVRVSTQRQGQFGTSLAEQKAAIERYAGRWNLNITKQYEERETAAKQGRRVFLEMLRALRNGKAAGLIVHKIDRSARNLKDWADLGSLIDKGIEVHFANESLDLNTRGGRLSADIQAVVAADYIRNLREETKKGIYGRLRQGLYPFRARVGYLDAGKGKPKEIDAIQAPLIKKAFELYATGDYGLDSLVEKMYELGLRNKNGRKISRNGLVCILKNPFYMGLIKMKTMDEIFVGIHVPIISKSLFDDVQNIFAGKRVKRKLRHFRPFRRHIICHFCAYFLIAEKQKGNIYYRCHTKDCRQNTVREDRIEAALLGVYKQLQFSDDEFEYLLIEANRLVSEEPMRIEAAEKQFALEMSGIEVRLAKLADAYMDGVFDKETYVGKKNEFVLRQQEMREKQRVESLRMANLEQQLKEFLELLKSVYLSYKLASEYEKREMLQITTSNFVAEGKTVSIKLKKPFQIVLERPRIPIGSPTRATSRTLSALLRELLKYFRNHGIDDNIDATDLASPKCVSAEF
jgi:DNA invertase Pin-like site-specific DNA recombinase